MWSLILLILAIVSFVFAAFGVEFRLDLVALGLAFFAASFLVNERGRPPNA